MKDECAHLSRLSSRSSDAISVRQSYQLTLGLYAHKRVLRPQARPNRINSSRAHKENVLCLHSNLYCLLFLFPLCPVLSSISPQLSLQIWFQNRRMKQKKRLKEGLIMSESTSPPPHSAGMSSLHSDSSNPASSSPKLDQSN